MLDEGGGTGLILRSHVVEASSLTERPISVPTMAMAMYRNNIVGSNSS